MKKLGTWSFSIGLILTVLVAVFYNFIADERLKVAGIFLIAVLGLVVGILNITDKEITLFLIASIAFLISFGALSNVFTVLLLGWPAVGTFFNLLTVFVAPAAAIVAIKALFNVTKD